MSWRRVERMTDSSMRPPAIQAERHCALAGHFVSASQPFNEAACNTGGTPEGIRLKEDGAPDLQ